MSETCGKGCEEKKSLRNLLEKPKIPKSTCSVNTESNRFPCIEEATTRKKTRKHRECKKVSSDDSTSRYWLKPGISLPKMHGKGMGDVPARKPTTSTSSSGDTWKFDTPNQSPEESIATPDACFWVKPTQVPGKIIGPSLCRSSFEVDYPAVTDNDLKLGNGSEEESPALKNWEKWMRIRRRQNDKFAEKLKRDKCKLVMNSGDCVREVREEKELLTYARIPKPDKWRGNPKWWEEPLKLAEKGMETEYYVYQTLSERGILPEMEFVTVPDVVKEEKDVGCAGCPGKWNWDGLEYRKIREQQLEGLLPQRTDARELIVLGQKIKPDVEKEESVQYDLPVIKVTRSDVCPRRMDRDGLFHYGVINLDINGIDLYSGGYNGCTGEVTPINAGHMWSLIFEGSVGTITEKTLLVENKGTVAVRYEWSRHKGDTYDSVFPARKFSSAGPRFFFNKNPGVFLPGQKTEIDFNHYSNHSGYQSETWCLRLNPNIFTEKDGARIRLVAVTADKDTIADYLKIDAYLNSCVKETVVRHVLWEIFQRAKPEIPKDIEYQSLFMEEELFEYQNPAHYYRYDTVEELKSLFKQIPLQPATEWDFNLFTLEDLIREYANGKEEREMMCRLMELSRSLLRPGPSKYKSDKKRKMLYNALCSVVDRIELNAERIRHVFSSMDSGNCDFDDDGRRPCSVKSGRSHVSSFTSLGVPEDGSLDCPSLSNNTVFRVTSKDVTHYRYVMHMTFFNYLCEAAELAAGVIESCKLFEHHGEVVTDENTNFLCDDSI